ncbi:putative FMN/FAD exporter YeeO [Sporomusa aerivorans]
MTGLEVIPGQALGLAITTVVAQCIGAKEYKQADKYIKYLLKLSWIYMITLNVVTMLLLKPILGLYNLSEGTFSLAFKIMLIHGIGCMTVWPASFTLPNAFRAAGDVKYPMFISILSMWFFRIGCSYLLAYSIGLGVLSVWIAMLVDWVFRSSCFIWRWRSGKWKNYAVV